MKNELISNVENINVSNNELMIKATLNRNFRKLFENDMNLMPDPSNNSHNNYRIMPYVPGNSYSKNDLVWFVDYYLSPKNERLYNEELYKLSSWASFREETVEDVSISQLKDKYYTVSLYLLRSLKNNNTTMPSREIVNMIPMFDASGWRNENPLGTIYTDYFEDFTAYILSNQLYNMHEASQEYHKFGKLSSFTELDSKVLKTDLQNLNPDRKHMMFPNVTYQIDEDDTILGGSVRLWDTGLVEYDITFQLGNTASSKMIYNADGTLKKVQTLDSNYFSLRQKPGFISDYDYYDNRRYYYQDDDADIFKVESDGTVARNSITQKNINSKINVFVGTVNFPISFIDTNYCIFTEMFPCVALNGTNDVEPNVNRLVYANKSRQSITAILIIPTYNGDTPKILYENEFRCHVCGRWK